MRTSTAVEKLWEAILQTARVDDDPIAAWEAHNADIQSRCDYLTGLGIETLEEKEAIFFAEVGA
jgi:leucyl aminopeptidase (aminopeptidase T)